MALIQCSFYSEVLELETEMLAILPEMSIGKRKKYPVLYLLHGLSGSYRDWQRKTSIERYVKEKEVVVIMPNVHRSFYCDMKNGYKYFEFISNELMDICQEFFPISDKREDTYVAGLSMGGFGAIKLALNYPSKFSKTATLSGAINMLENIKVIQEIITSHNNNNNNNNTINEFKDFKYNINEFKNIFGSYLEMKESCNDFEYLINNSLSKDIELPEIYICCGTEDPLYEDNKRFRKLLESKDITFTYEEEKGNHCWEFWDKMIINVIDWLNL